MEYNIIPSLYVVLFTDGVRPRVRSLTASLAQWIHCRTVNPEARFVFLEVPSLCVFEIMVEPYAFALPINVRYHSNCVSWVYWILPHPKELSWICLVTFPFLEASPPAFSNVSQLEPDSNLNQSTDHCTFRVTDLVNLVLGKWEHIMCHFWVSLHCPLCYQHPKVVKSEYR